MFKSGVYYQNYQRVQSHSLSRDEQGDNGFSGTLRGVKQLLFMLKNQI